MEEREDAVKIPISNEDMTITVVLNKYYGDCKEGLEEEIVLNQIHDLLLKNKHELKEGVDFQRIFQFFKKMEELEDTSLLPKNEELIQLQKLFSHFERGIEEEKNKICPRYGEKKNMEGHDNCLAELPGVTEACCDQDRENGYIVFENGVVLRGSFEVA